MLTPYSSVFPLNVGLIGRGRISRMEFGIIGIINCSLFVNPCPFVNGVFYSGGNGML